MNANYFWNRTNFIKISNNYYMHTKQYLTAILFFAAILFTTHSSAQYVILANITPSDTVKTIPINDNPFTRAQAIVHRGIVFFNVDGIEITAQKKDADFSTKNCVSEFPQLKIKKKELTRGNFVSCVMSFWESDQINSSGLPPLLEQVMELRK